METPSRTYVFMELSTDGQTLGKLVMELFDDVVPKTAANFAALCVGSGNCKTRPDVPLHYKGSAFHRIIKGFMAQGGDFTCGNGTGGESIYGSRFPDENFSVRHEPYALSMANAGPNTNGSQFFITFGDTPWLDGRHVVFGKVVSGFELMKEVESYGTDNGQPTRGVVVADCGRCTKTGEPLSA